MNRTLVALALVGLAAAAPTTGEGARARRKGKGASSDKHGKHSNGQFTFTIISGGTGTVAAPETTGGCCFQHHTHHGNLNSVVTFDHFVNGNVEDCEQSAPVSVAQNLQSGHRVVTVTSSSYVPRSCKSFKQGYSTVGMIHFAGDAGSFDSSCRSLKKKCKGQCKWSKGERECVSVDYVAPCAKRAKTECNVKECKWIKGSDKRCTDSGTAGVCAADVRVCEMGSRQVTLERLPSYGCLFPLCPVGYTVTVGVTQAETCAKFDGKKQQCKKNTLCKYNSGSKKCGTQPQCPPETNSGADWEASKPGLVTSQCPADKPDGTIKRWCSAKGTWNKVQNKCKAKATQAESCAKFDGKKQQCKKNTLCEYNSGSKTCGAAGHDTMKPNESWTTCEAYACKAGYEVKDETKECKTKGQKMRCSNSKCCQKSEVTHGAKGDACCTDQAGINCTPGVTLPHCGEGLYCLFEGEEIGAPACATVELELGDMCHGFDPKLGKDVSICDLCVEGTVGTAVKGVSTGGSTKETCELPPDCGAQPLCIPRQGCTFTGDAPTDENGCAAGCPNEDCKSYVKGEACANLAVNNCDLCEGGTVGRNVTGGGGLRTCEVPCGAQPLCIPRQGCTFVGDAPTDADGCINGCAENECPPIPEGSTCAGDVDSTFVDNCDLCAEGTVATDAAENNQGATKTCEAVEKEDEVVCAEPMCISRASCTFNSTAETAKDEDGCTVGCLPQICPAISQGRPCAGHDATLQDDFDNCDLCENLTVGTYYTGTSIPAGSVTKTCEFDCGPAPFCVARAGCVLEEGAPTDANGCAVCPDSSCPAIPADSACAGVDLNTGESADDCDLCEAGTVGTDYNGTAPVANGANVTKTCQAAP